MKKLFASLGMAAALFAGTMSFGTTAASAEGGEVLNVCPEMTDSVVRLYSAYFLRGPDAGGVDFWIREYSENGRTLGEMSDFFSSSDEFIGLYGSLDNRAFVNLIYRNILGRAGEASGVNFWTGRLDSGEQNRGEIMLQFSEGPEYVQLTGTAPPLAGYYQSYPEGTVWACGTTNETIRMNRPGGPVRVDGFAALEADGGTSTENFIAWTLDGQQGNNDLIINETVLRGQYYFFWDLVADGGRSQGDSRYLDIRGIDANQSGFHWTIVMYPTSIGSARGGWGD